MDEDEIISGIVDTDPFISSSSSAKESYFWEETAPWYIRLKDSSCDDFTWSRRQTRDVILDFNTSGLVQKGPKLPFWLMYNPVYWGVFTICWAAVFLGKRFHSMFDQGGKVRLDESEVEHDARVIWIYPCSGIQGIILVFDIYNTTTTTLSASIPFLTALLSTLASIAYLTSGVRFYRAMQRHLAWEAKLIILTNSLYSLCLVATIAIGIIEIHSGTAQRSTIKVVVYGLQILLVFFIVAGLLTSAHQLWFDYDEADHRKPPRYGTIIPAAVLFLTVLVPTVFEFVMAVFRVFF